MPLPPVLGGGGTEGQDLLTITQSPSQRLSPSAQRGKTAQNYSPSATVRHEPVMEAAEPKVYSPFKSRPGQGN